MKKNKQIIKIFTTIGFILLIGGIIFLEFYLYSNKILKCKNFPLHTSDVSVLEKYSYENIKNIKGFYDIPYEIGCFPGIDVGSFDAMGADFAKDKNHIYYYSTYQKGSKGIIVINKKLDTLDSDSFQVKKKFKNEITNNLYFIVSDKNGIYFYGKNKQLEKTELNQETFEIIKVIIHKIRSTGEQEKMYFQDKNGLYYSTITENGIDFHKVLNTTIETGEKRGKGFDSLSNFLDTGGHIVRENKVLEYIDYETLVGIGSIQEFKKDKNNVYDKNFEIIPYLNPGSTIDVGHDNKYYLSDGKYFYLTEEVGIGVSYDTPILVKKTSELIESFKEKKKFYDNGGY